MAWQAAAPAGPWLWSEGWQEELAAPGGTLLDPVPPRELPVSGGCLSDFSEHVPCAEDRAYTPQLPPSDAFLLEGESLEELVALADIVGYSTSEPKSSDLLQPAQPPEPYLTVEHTSIRPPGAPRIPALS